MKPFNPEEAKAGKPVCNGLAETVEIKAWDMSGHYPLLAVVHSQGRKEPGHYTTDGRADVLNKCPKLDLYMAPTKVKGWIAVRLEPRTGIMLAFASHVFNETTIKECYDTKYGWQHIQIEWEE